MNTTLLNGFTDELIKLSNTKSRSSAAFGELDAVMSTTPTTKVVSSPTSSMPKSTVPKQAPVAAPAAAAPRTPASVTVTQGTQKGALTLSPADKKLYDSQLKDAYSKIDPNSKVPISLQRTIANQKVRNNLANTPSSTAGEVQ